MLNLPIDAAIPELLESLRANPSVVLVAPPGAGKTTRVSPAIIRDNLLSKENPHLIMLQPRRVAARASAQRIAEEQSWQLGQQVGYHIRFEKRYGTSTRIRVLTEAILTRILLADASLEGIGGVILDEFHERNLHTDLALAFLREIQQTIRPDLKILVMSATLDAQSVAAFLGNCPIVHSEGRLFPVEVSYRPLRDRALDAHIAATVDDALQQPGDLLVFLPGVGEIERTRRALGSREGVAILPLHGSLSSEEQQRALQPDTQGRQKIILATNIAETSLTIDGVRTVIDSGLVRIASFDADRGMDRLDLARISKASATQRAGRAGRQAPGITIRLWSQQEQNHLADFTPPEIHRVDLSATLLAVHSWGAKDPRTFAWFDPPEEEMLTAAEKLLTLLGALDEGTLTDAGRQMLHIPAHPRIARLLMAALGTAFLPDALTLATILSDDSRAPSSGASDLITLRVAPHQMRIRDQLAAITQQLHIKLDTGNSKLETPQDLLLLAFPDRIARRRGNDPYAAVMVGGAGLRLAPEALTPALAEAELFLALDPHHDPRNKKAEATVRTAIPIALATLQRIFPENFHTQNALEYDVQKQKVVALTRRFFTDLLLEEDPHGKVDPQRAGETLAAALAPRAPDLFTQHEAASRLMARTALVRHYLPEHPWPRFDKDELEALLKDAAAGKRTLAELTEGPALTDALRSALPYPLDRLLNQLAPETLAVPSGSQIKLEYTLPAEGAVPPAPILAVRLQELFGLLETPRLANGRASVLLHLLSPGYKPIQITSDLRSFWSAAYFEVRKDLRTRYPKHKWPDDPLTAIPEAKGRRKN